MSADAAPPDSARSEDDKLTLEQKYGVSESYLKLTGACCAVTLALFLLVGDLALVMTPVYPPPPRPPTRSR